MRTLSSWRPNYLHTRTLTYHEGKNKIDVHVTYNQNDTYDIEVNIFHFSSSFFFFSINGIKKIKIKKIK